MLQVHNFFREGDDGSWIGNIALLRGLAHFQMIADQPRHEFRFGFV